MTRTRIMLSLKYDVLDWTRVDIDRSRRSSFTFDSIPATCTRVSNPLCPVLVKF